MGPVGPCPLKEGDDASGPGGEPEGEYIVLHYLDVNEYLSDTLPGYASERAEPRRLISKMLTSAVPHWSEPASVFTRRWKGRSGHSPDTFRRVNENYGLFDVADSFEHGSAKPHYPTEKTRSLRAEMPRAPVRRAKKVRNVWVDVPSEAEGRAINAGGLTIASAVPLDRAAIQHFRDVGYKNIQRSEFHKLDPSEYWRDYASMLAAYLDNLTTPEQLPCDYHLGECGRVLGVGLGFQNMRKELRAAALNGLWDYDIKNCHIAIAAQEMQARGYAVPSMTEYDNDPDSIRLWLADAFGVRAKQIKTALLAMLNGAGVEALTPILGDATEDFLSYPWVDQFRKDCRAVRKVFRCKPTTLLFRKEHEILKAATDEIMVPMFDGWVSALDHCPRDIEARVKDSTGYTIKIKKEPICYEFSAPKD